MSRRGLGSLLSVGAPICLALPLWAQGLPPDPDRPLPALTCAAARARLTEAEAGSPLVSAAEAEAHLLEAQARVAALCAPTPPRPTQPPAAQGPLRCP